MNYRTTLIALSLLGPAAHAEGPATVPLRVVTFNAEILTAPGVRAGQLQKYRFDFARRLHIERVADLIETLNPDILNLVEVTSTEAVDQVVEILHEKGLNRYRGYHVESVDTFTGMDVALISKIEPDLVDGSRIHAFHSGEGDPTWRQAFSFTGYSGDRLTRTTGVNRHAVYFFSIGGHKLGFLGLHLKSDPSDDYSNARRTAECAVATRIMRGEIARRGYSPVVLGDLNDYDPDIPDRDHSRSTSTQVLRALKDYNPEKPGDELVNAARWISRKADRYTSHWDRNENGARDPQDVFTMIDHVLLPSWLAPSVKRVFICRSVAIDTSDHYPVVVDLLLRPAQ